MAAPVAQAATPEILTIAVFDFESKDEAVRDLGPKVATLVNATLSAEPNLITVERAELEKVLGEQELGLSGTVSADSAAKVGGTETSRVYGEMVKGGPSASIADLAADLAKKIGATVGEKGGTLVAKVETPEARLERLKKSLRGDQRPVLGIKIAERHLNGPTIDPAAETELGKIAGDCGFKLADDKTSLKADIEITGEALSELGLRKGNLVSCKARVEIKVRERSTGNILFVDRQISVAVDLMEQVAAKTALQNAATELAERVLPRLVNR
ncbi:MAG: curli assembly protein CsgG [Verrucomicrobia bacterium]|nr:curli assembly protein CsgG [Verrucomicrobiota bacterium]